jgi:hypothetical protein
MSILKKRNWKTVELSEADMAGFASMGGLEIDVLSDVPDLIGPGLKDTLAASTPSSKPKKKKSVKTKQEILSVENQVSETQSSTEVDIKVDMSEWDKFCLHPEILNGLTSLGFSKPSPVQSAVIEKSVEGFDVLAAAQTGSGKTLAFGLPILHAILSSKSEVSENCTRAICILPTRELALQVKKHLEAVTGSSVSVGSAVGGMSIEKQFRTLEFQAVFWIFIFTGIINDDSTIAYDFHDLTRNSFIFVCYKIADVDLHTSSSWM